MKKLTLIVFLTVFSFIFGGCAIFSPFKPINTCANAKNGGAACESIESNLEYSIATNGKTPPIQDDKKSKKEKSKETAKDIQPTPSAIHSDKDVEKAELIRLITLMNINIGLSQEPILIPSASYKVVILPYSDGKKFYSGRNIFIIAGKPRWVAGNFLMSGERYKIQENTINTTQKNKDNPVPEKVSANFLEEKKADNQTVEPIVETPKNNVDVIDLNAWKVNKEASNISKSLPKPKIFKHRVSAYLLNCRDNPSIQGISIAVFEKDAILNITDRTNHWWKVSHYDVECYVNSSYLYNEQEL